MGELLGITGAIGSGKTTFAELLGRAVQNHAHYEANGPIIEVANRFNQLLEAELNFETTDDDTEMINQVLIWMPDVISEHLHRDVSWTHIAITPKDTRAHPELYEKLFAYVKRARGDHTLTENTITADKKGDYRELLQWLGGYFVAKISPTIWYDELFRRIDMHESFRSLVIMSGVRYISDATVVREHGGRIVRITRPGHETKSNDVTEAERNDIAADITVINNGTLEQLQILTETIWDDIAAGNPKQTYTAA